MNNTNHTPAPWIHNKEFRLYKEDNYSQIVAGSGAHLKDKAQGFSITGVMSDADAKLIAAAPDLLQALLAAQSDCRFDGFICAATAAQIREAIKKATE